MDRKPLPKFGAEDADTLLAVHEGSIDKNCTLDLVILLRYTSDVPSYHLMPTKKRRLNITLSKDAAFFVKQIALRDEVPEATKISELVELALEIEEDMYLSRKSDELLERSKGKTISHKEFWSKLL